MEEVAESIRRKKDVGDLVYVENSEKNFLEKNVIRKFFVGEDGTVNKDSVVEVKKDDLFDGIVKKKDEAACSIKGAPGYIDLMTSK